MLDSQLHRTRPVWTRFGAPENTGFGESTPAVHREPLTSPLRAYSRLDGPELVKPHSAPLCPTDRTEAASRREAWARRETLSTLRYNHG